MTRDAPAARAFEERLRIFFQRHIQPISRQGLCPVALDKALAAAGGWCHIAPRVRWPYASATDDVMAWIGRLARSELPELWP